MKKKQRRTRKRMIKINVILKNSKTILMKVNCSLELTNRYLKILIISNKRYHLRVEETMKVMRRIKTAALKLTRIRMILFSSYWETV